ncbi:MULTISPECIES: sugar ABC transporter permease [Paenibacillus]|uniref:Sugar ABC transporter permease n=1 Tax=Paenibacillus agaridevorans TaxID=171404 RepID=A0A2R5EYF8_9BACL|nr:MULTISPECIES: ABC transporter permease subunit [Paenibacillus]QNK55875.1 sugar ABC transporter permease [Paenibacillus sp. PAMC21692]GBG08411.1 sugar ABC transporter permease [Paenibacillus agaridevorans]
MGLLAFAKELKTNKYIYLMIAPVLLYYAIFHYGPMYGAIIAFKDFTPAVGIWGSPWSGFGHFTDFFNGIYFWRILKNTILISVYELVFGFPAPILLALLLNELRSAVFKRTVQTITYMPHFISLVVICGILKDFTSSGGIITLMYEWISGRNLGESLLLQPEMFRTIFVSSGIYQQIGWGTIIYLAALTGIDMEQYEAARMDGANRFRQMIHITLPGILPTVVIMLILNLGQMLSVGFEKIILLYSPITYETADVISSYVYRIGLQDFNYSLSAAVGLFNSVINFILVILANAISRKLNDTSLW